MPIFFVPPLEDVPQNPIMDNLKIEEANLNLPKRLTRTKNLVESDAKDAHEATRAWSLEEDNRKELKAETLWAEAAKPKVGFSNGLLSWDRLRPTHNTKASRTAFLSELDDHMLSSARYHVQPLLRDPTHVITTTTQSELLTCLKTAVLGISSRLYVWDSNLERFLQTGTENHAKAGIILVDGKDTVLTESFTARFITIGTLLRRLELFLSYLRNRSAKDGPTIHSLAHSLSTTFDYIRQKLVECPPNNIDLVGDNRLAQIWSCYEPYEELLVALADLCGRNESFKTTEYLHLESDPVPLLSRLYEHLTLHFERQSPHLNRAVMAFILSSTSSEYIQHVAHSIGFGGQLKPRPRKLNDSHITEFEDDEEEEDEILELLDRTDTRFPNFFPPEMLNLLPAAQKSLVLLKVAQPDHALLINGRHSPIYETEVRWLWRTDEIEAVWNCLPLPLPTVSLESGSPVLSGPSGTSYRSELSAFHIFDLEPGTVELAGLSSDTNRKGIGTSTTSLSSFISSFPSSLPLITPTLSSLASLTFRPLTAHASTLSTTLLQIFIDQPGKLNFCKHLVLLRDFMLVSKPDFKSKLMAALFDDAGEFGAERSSAHSLSVRAVRKRQLERYTLDRTVDKQGKGNEQKDESGMPWAVGLAYHLMERETWPPVGADLAFHLRTVIVDSLNRTKHESRKGDEEVKGSMLDTIILEEAEWRLGFAIKDLPVGSGKEKWMDPLSIEALDFLCMDYKPPRPLEVLISPEILSKYQRMFAFILRLLRVENALKTLFRMSTHRTEGMSLFPTLTKSRRLLLHFRFVAQAFVSGLSGYVFDSAIGGNFDPFLSQLSFSSSAHETRRPSFSDVFELAQCHSALLNDVLSACLLRSGQKGVGDLLRQSMETVLEFTIVVGELQRGRIEEYQASPMIEELYKKFCVKLTMLANVLKGLIDKSPTRSAYLDDYYMGGSQRPTGGLDALQHLLLRLDLTDWWSLRKSKIQKPE